MLGMNPSLVIPNLSLVIPAKAGIQMGGPGVSSRWIPAFAGMTKAGEPA